MASSEKADLLKRFYFLQAERVETYKLFDEGHVAYLNGAPDYNFQMYRQLINEITQTFKKISDEIIDIEGKFRNNHNLSSIASYLSKVQEEEQKKLEVTAKLQVASQNVQDHPEQQSAENEARDLRKQLQEVKGRIIEHLEELKYESEDFVNS